MTAAGTPGPAADPYERFTGPVRQWFGSSRANFVVLHRARAQSMPLDWQQQFTRLLEEFQAAYPGPADTEFRVTTVRERYVEDLTEDELTQLRVTINCGGPAYISRDATELPAGSRVGIPVPGPVPHYFAGYLPPDEKAIAAARAARQDPAGERNLSDDVKPR
jgi:hypothetical protein